MEGVAHTMKHVSMTMAALVLATAGMVGAGGWPPARLNGGEWDALTINVNIDRVARAGLIGPTGVVDQTWNEVLGNPPIVAGSLLDASGAATTVGLTVNASNVDWWNNPSLTLLTSAAFNWSPNDPYVLTINGLADDKKYDLYLASFHPNEDGNRALFSTLNTTDTLSPQVADSGGPGGNSSAWVEGVNYVRFQKMQSDSGLITITIVGQDTGGNRRRAYISGFQLVEVAIPPPPPKTVLIVR